MPHTQTNSMGLTMATILGLNAIIGAGIFGVPAALQHTAGPVGILTYGIVIAAVLAIAFGFAALTATKPTNCMFYTYTAAWAGHRGGIIATVSYVLGLAVALGLLATIAGGTLARYGTFFSAQQWGLLLLLALAGLNALGAVINKIGQVILLILTIAPLALITALCLAKAQPAHLLPFAPHGWLSIIRAIPIVAFGFFGFEAIPSLFTAIKDPQKNVPRAIVAAIVITGILYCTFVLSIMLGIPSALFDQAGAPLSQTLLRVFPEYHWLVAAIDWAIIITIAGTLHAMLWAISNLMVQTWHTIRRTNIDVSFGLALKLLTAASCVSCIAITNIDQAFGLVALGIAGAFAAAQGALIISTSSRDRQRGIVGIIGATVIFCSALYALFAA